MSKEKNKGHKEKKKPKANKASKTGNNPSNTVGNAIEKDHHKHDH
jgi:hypothetical protein